MAGLLNYDDEPMGLLAGLQRSATNPLTLAGLGLLTGQGFGGAMRGAQLGMGFDEQRRADQQRKLFQGLLQDPSVTQAIPAPMLSVAQMAGPSGGAELLAKYLDPAREADLAYKKALTAKAQKEASDAAAKYGKTGAIFQADDGKFYTMQFANDGTTRIQPAQIPGQEGSAPVGLTPARGVMNVGDELIDKATGGTVRNVGGAITQGKIAEGEGTNVAKVRADLPEAKMRLDMVTGGLDRLEQTATGLATQPGLESVVGGLYQAYTPNVSEKALNAQTELDNLKVKISGVVLQSMRDMSKTGGAVGQVTEREWPRLENMLANLDPKQGRPQFMRNLQQIVAYTQQVKAQLREAYEADLRTAQGGGFSPPGAAPQPQQRPDPLGLFGGN